MNAFSIIHQEKGVVCEHFWFKSSLFWLVVKAKQAIWMQHICFCKLLWAATQINTYKIENMQNKCCKNKLHIVIFRYNPI